VGRQAGMRKREDATQSDSSWAQLDSENGSPGPLPDSGAKESLEEEEDDTERCVVMCTPSYHFSQEYAEFGCNKSNYLIL
jgi:hypothetical protein